MTEAADFLAKVKRFQEETINKTIAGKVTKYTEGYTGVVTETDINHGDRYTFAVTHTITDQISKGSHIYGLYAFRGEELIYYSANVVDRTHRHTPADAQQAATNYFNHIAKSLNSLK